MSWSKPFPKDWCRQKVCFRPETGPEPFSHQWRATLFYIILVGVLHSEGIHCYRKVFGLKSLGSNSVPVPGRNLLFVTTVYIPKVVQHTTHLSLNLVVNTLSLTPGRISQH